jgi:hypothetical protein
MTDPYFDPVGRFISIIWMIDVSLSRSRLVTIRARGVYGACRDRCIQRWGAAVATLILGAAMRGLRAFQMRDQSLELRPAG